VEFDIEILKELKNLKRQVADLRRLEKGNFMDDSIGSGGWIEVPDGSWTYASANTITVPSGAALIYEVSDQLRAKQGVGYKFWDVIGVADTVLTVTGGSDYTVANATITDAAFSKGGGVGHPVWFDYTPTGIAASNVTLEGRFCILPNRLCYVYFLATFAGAITYTTGPTLPVPVSSNLLVPISDSIRYHGFGSYRDAGTGFFPDSLYITFNASDTIFNLRIQSNANIITATTPITWANGDEIYAEFSYEI